MKLLQFLVASVVLLAVSAATPPNCPQKGAAQPFYRTQLTARTDHLYTLDLNEYMKAVKNLKGVPQGISCRIFQNNVVGTVPFYRLNNAATTAHFYTTTSAEAQTATNSGYKSEGIAGYVYKDNSCGGVPFYRLHQSTDKGYLYTTSTKERDDAVARGGYLLEGIAGYVYPAVG